MLSTPRLLARSMWSFCLLEGQPTSTLLVQQRRIRHFDSRRLRTGSRHIHTQADPFLFVDGDYLYVFYEVQEVSDVGYIVGCRTKNLESFEDLGVVLRRGEHVSYPYVFRTSEGIFMLPETREAGEVALYRFAEFPFDLRRERRLIKGAYTDPTLVRASDRWWLFATGAEGLELFSATDLHHGEFEPHPMNPICTDPRLSRCGGAIIEMEGRLYRPAQASIVEDGCNLRMLAINELSPERYSEAAWAPEFFALTEPWQVRGAHHLSAVKFGDRNIVAVDGRHPDYVINGTFLNPMWRLVSALQSWRRLGLAGSQPRTEPIAEPQPLSRRTHRQPTCPSGNPLL